MRLPRRALLASALIAPPLPAFSQSGSVRPLLRVGVPEVPPTLEPARELSNVGTRVTYSIFDTLIRRDFLGSPDGGGSGLKPGLATAWERNGPQELVLKRYVHLGVAIDTPRGLVVPVIRDVDKKSIIQLAVELTQASDKAWTGKLGINDLQGGTFTITNLGGLGTTYFSPIVNYPEVAILGVGRATTEPVWVEGAFKPRLMIPLSLSFDHRVVDGADGARFLHWIVEAIENPLLLAM